MRLYRRLGGIGVLGGISRGCMRVAGAYGKRLEELSIPSTPSNDRTGGPIKAQFGHGCPTAPIAPPAASYEGGCLVLLISVHPPQRPIQPRLMPPDTPIPFISLHSTPTNQFHNLPRFLHKAIRSRLLLLLSGTEAPCHRNAIHPGISCRCNVNLGISHENSLFP